MSSPNYRKPDPILLADINSIDHKNLSAFDAFAQGMQAVFRSHAREVIAGGGKCPYCEGCSR